MSMVRQARPRAHREQGAIAIMVALSMVALCIGTAMVLDFGMVRIDRQKTKLAADAAVMAGLRAADQDNGDVYTSLGVCGALVYLKANRPALSGLPDGVCATPDPAKFCVPGNSGTATYYSGSTTSGSSTYEVWIKSPYTVTSTDGGGAFAEEGLGTLGGDVGDTTKSGCDQIGVIVRESTTPGLGRIVTDGPLVSRIRSVGRVKINTGDVPPALLLLERTRCSVLTVGSAGSPSRIAVAGSGTTAASIHSDSDATGSDCGSGSNQQLFQGKQTDGVIAYGGSGGSSGTITSVATYLGRLSSIVADNPSNVYGTTAIYPATGGTPSAITGRKQVTRRPVDKRYLPGVTTAVTNAFSMWGLNHSSPGAGWTFYGCPTSSNMTAMAAMTAASSVYIDCANNSGITLDGTIGAGRIYFHGFIKNGNLAMPNATEVYVDNTKDNGVDRISNSAITLGNNNSFCVRATLVNCNASTPATGQCSDAPTGSASAKARLMIRRGSVDSNGGSSAALIRLCSTTAIMEGGQLGSGTSGDPGGCLPTSWGTAPTSTPCTGASSGPEGSSKISLAGYTDWTAPNSIGSMTGLSDSAKQALWDGGEDLALWDETYGVGSDYKMAGGGKMHVGGVFMVPNAYPFNISGGGTQDLSNAQYITRAFAVDGGATLKMKVDPYNAVGYPTLDPFTLVR